MRYHRRSVVLFALIAGVALGFAQPLAHTQAGDASQAPARLDGDGGRHASTISPDQIERLEVRIEAITRLLDRFESDARARGLASGWRQAAADTLLRLPLDALQRAEREAFSLDALSSVRATPGPTSDSVSAADGDPNLLGDRSKDLVYTPTTPCRFIDTRTFGTKINGVSAFDADVSGSTYGGSPACNLAFTNGPAKNVGALAMNVTLVDTSAAPAPGFVAVKPSAQSPTVSLLNWHEQGAHVQVANLAIVTLAQPDIDLADFVIQTSGPVHIIVDIFGAFVTPFKTTLETTHVINSAVIRKDSAGTAGAQCPSLYRLTGGGCYSDQFGNYLSAIDTGGDGSTGVFCQARNTSGIDVVLFARAICARIPGR